MITGPRTSRKDLVLSERDEFQGLSVRSEPLIDFHAGLRVRVAAPGLRQCGNQPVVQTGLTNPETRLARSKRGLFGSFLETECSSLRRRSPEVWDRSLLPNPFALDHVERILNILISTQAPRSGGPRRSRRCIGASPSSTSTSSTSSRPSARGRPRGNGPISRFRGDRACSA